MDWSGRRKRGRGGTPALSDSQAVGARRSKELPAGAVSKKELNRKYATIGILSCVMLGLLVVVAMTSERSSSLATYTRCGIQAYASACYRARCGCVGAGLPYQATRAHHDIPLYAARVVCMLCGGSSVAHADGMGCTRCVTALNVLNKHKDKLGRLDSARIERAQQNQFPGKVYKVPCTVHSCNKHECNVLPTARCAMTLATCNDTATAHRCGRATVVQTALRTADIPRKLTLHTVVAMHDAYGAYGPMQPLHVRRIARCRAALPFGISHCAVPITYASACLGLGTLGHTARLRRRACLTLMMCCSGGGAFALAIGGGAVRS